MKDSFQLPEDDASKFLAVEDALNNLDLVEAPPELLKTVMAQVRGTPQPHFQLGWSDLLVSIFFAGILLMVGLVANMLPVDLRNYLHLEGLYWLQRFELQPLVPVTLIAGGLLALGGLGIIWMSLRVLHEHGR
jgi:hypothetical protein